LGGSLACVFVPFCSHEENRKSAISLDHIRSEIEHMRRQIIRQRKDIKALQQAGISSTAADAMLGRMQNKVDGLCTERACLLGEARV
jgi:hypothetical protein